MSFWGHFRKPQHPDNQVRIFEDQVQVLNISTKSLETDLSNRFQVPKSNTLGRGIGIDVAASIWSFPGTIFESECSESLVQSVEN